MLPSINLVPANAYPKSSSLKNNNDSLGIT